MTTMRRASSAPAGQSILVHVRKVACTTESHPTSADVNAWLIIRDTATGPEMSEIFRNLPENKPVHSRTRTGCVFVGSHLYDIGGCGSKPNGEDYFCNQIRHLDTNNLNGGWMSEELPIYCPNPTTAVFGEFIYIFPKSQWFTTVEELEDEAPPPWAYVYDTIQKKAFELKLPDGCIPTRVSFCASLEGRGVLVPINYQKGRRVGLYLHKPKDMMWEESDSPPFSAFTNIYGNPYAVLNNILYVYCLRNDAATLEVYDIRTGESLPTIKLPTFDNMGKACHKWNTFIVPVTDSEFCFLWHKRPYWYKDLYYARVSLDPFAGAATLLEQAVIRIDALEVINCLPYASLPDDHNIEEEVDEIDDTTSKKRKQYEIDHYIHLEEELDWASKKMEKVCQRMKCIDGILQASIALLSIAESSWKQGFCLYIEKEFDCVEEEMQRVQKRLKKAYSTLSPELQLGYKKERKKQDLEDEFCNTRLGQYAAHFQKLISSVMVLVSLLQSRKTFTQFHSDAQLLPEGSD